MLMSRSKYVSSTSTTGSHWNHKDGMLSSEQNDDGTGGSLVNSSCTTTNTKNSNNSVSHNTDTTQGSTTTYTDKTETSTEDTQKEVDTPIRWRYDIGARLGKGVRIFFFIC